jgi:hypothetical protein
LEEAGNNKLHVGGGNKFIFSFFPFFFFFSKHFYGFFFLDSFFGLFTFFSLLFPFVLILKTNLLFFCKDFWMKLWKNKFFFFYGFFWP